MDRIEPTTFHILIFPAMRSENHTPRPSARHMMCEILQTNHTGESRIKDLSYWEEQSHSNSLTISLSLGISWASSHSPVTPFEHAPCSPRSYLKSTSIRCSTPLHPSRFPSLFLTRLLLRILLKWMRWVAR